VHELIQSVHLGTNTLEGGVRRRHPRALCSRLTTGVAQGRDGGGAPLPHDQRGLQGRRAQRGADGHVLGQQKGHLPPLFDGRTPRHTSHATMTAEARGFVEPPCCAACVQFFFHAMVGARGSPTPPSSSRATPIVIRRRRGRVRQSGGLIDCT
jgi:hypothetical protein